MLDSEPNAISHTFTANSPTAIRQIRADYLSSTCCVHTVNWFSSSSTPASPLWSSLSVPAVVQRKTSGRGEGGGSFATSFGPGRRCRRRRPQKKVRTKSRKRVGKQAEGTPAPSDRNSTFRRWQRRATATGGKGASQSRKSAVEETAGLPAAPPLSNGRRDRPEPTGDSRAACTTATWPRLAQWVYPPPVTCRTAGSGRVLVGTWCAECVSA